jgi:3-oxoacyl-[acyl-carrier protein] reductase
VAGGSKGIGRSIVRSLASEGCRVVACARNASELDLTVAAMRSEGLDVVGVADDLTDSGAGDRLVAESLSTFGRIDILVNNIGGNLKGSAAELTDAEWIEIIDLNLLTAMRLTRAAVPHLVAQRSGSIVFVASIFGRETGGAGRAAYTTSKAAMISAAKVMALELASDGVRVNSVAPGSIRHPESTWERYMQQDPEGMAKFIEANLPLGRFGSAEEVADVVTFLASERASLITGACLAVDGSQSRSGI